MSTRTFKLAVAIAIMAAAASLAGVMLGLQHPSTGATAATAATTSPSPSGRPWAGREGRFAHGGSFVGGHGSGTVTGISGTTLTLRTLTGTLTVSTTPSTTYTREGKSIAFGDIKTGDIVQVRPVRPSGSSTPPASPPTTVTAQSITIQVPAFFGRAVSISGPTIFIVTSDGQMAYVYTTATTSYTMNGASAAFGDVKPGEYITAQGTRTDLTHLTADRVVISTSARPGGGAPFHPHASPSPTGTGTAS